MLKPEHHDLQLIYDFLRVPTAEAWCVQARTQCDLLLLDHAHCERKAAATAIHLISKYPEKEALIISMSQLAREELLHFEKVLSCLQRRHITYKPLHPSTYAQRLHELVHQRDGKQRLTDQLIVGAIIEARSCERFAMCIPLFEDKALSQFYRSLVKSESRHFQDYLKLAYLYGEDVEARIARFLDLENMIINGPDTVFRFHSGVMEQAEMSPPAVNLI